MNITVNPKDYALEEVKAAQIADQFKPMLDKMVELEKEFNEIAALPVEDVETSKKAKELRLKYVKVRTGTAEIHKAQKAFYLSAGKYIDGWKNAQLFASEGIESKLETIENYYENLEKQKVDALNKERVELLKTFEIDGSGFGLGNMAQDVWDNYISGVKLQFEAKQVAAKKAEEDRLAAIEAEKARQKAIEEENTRLKIQAEAKEKELEKERAEAKAKQEEQTRLAAEIKAKADAALAAEKEKADKAAKEQAEALRIEKEKADKLAAQIKAKADAEAKEAADRLAAEKKAAKAPDKVKMIAWVDALELPIVDLKEKDAGATAIEIRAKFDGFKKWAKEQVNAL